MSSLYKISKSKKGSYYFFKTKNAIVYNCYFTESLSHNDILGLTVNNTVYNFIIRRKTKVDSHTIAFDPMIGKTIADLLNRFFLKDPRAIIGYICDNHDRKAFKRQISFNHWLVKYNHDEPKKVLIRADIQNVFHAGAILLAENHERKTIENHFRRQLKEYRESQKTASVEIIE